MKKQEMNLGKKIKDIEIDKFQANFLLIMLLVLFNVFLILAVISLIIALNKWYIWLIDVLVVSFCVIRSVVTYFKSQKNSYVIYSNAIKINTVWYESVIELNSIYKIVPKQTLFDKIMKRKNFTLSIYFYDEGYYSVKIYHIKEDVYELIKQITEHVVKAKETTCNIHEPLLEK